MAMRVAVIPFVILIAILLPLAIAYLHHEAKMIEQVKKELEEDDWEDDE